MNLESIISIVGIVLGNAITVGVLIGAHGREANRNNQQVQIRLALIEQKLGIEFRAPN